MIQKSQRCRWATKSPRLLEYHDNEWGVPEFNERKLFKALALEVFQAGLTWELILKRRPALVRAFDNFDYLKVANYDEVKFDRLLNDASIIRNHAKVAAVIDNAKALVNLHRKGLTLRNLTWRLVNGVPLDHLLQSSKTKLKYFDFIKPYLIQFRYYYFKRIGPKTLYSYLQAVGVVNDHVMSCFRHEQISRLVGGAL